MSMENVKKGKMKIIPRFWTQGQRSFRNYTLSCQFFTVLTASVIWCSFPAFSSQKLKTLMYFGGRGSGMRSDQNFATFHFC